MKLIRILLLCLPLLAATSVAHAQEYTMLGRSGLELRFGVWSGAKTSNIVTVKGIFQEAKTGAFVGGLQFTHWMKEDLAVTFSAGLLSGKVTSTVTAGNVSQHVSTVAPVLLGMQYYLGGGTSEIRPFLLAGVGPYVGSESNNTIHLQEARTEVAFGGRFCAGVDFLVTDHFKFGANAGYNMMTDYDVPIGARTNYNGVDFQVGVGYLF